MVGVLVMLLLAQAPAATTEAPILVHENGSNARSREGVLELRGNKGWVRTEHPVLDFELRFEIRALGPDADPGLIVRTWTGRWPQTGYRLTVRTVRPLPVQSARDAHRVR